MNARERILACMQGQPVDRIPFAPLIDPYSLIDMPGEIFAGCRPSYEDISGFKGLIAGARWLGCDIMLRHVPVIMPYQGNAPHMQSIASFEPPVETYGERRRDLWIETMLTPVGALRGVWGYSGYASWIPHPVRHPVTTPEELKIFHYAVDHLSTRSLTPDFRTYLELDQEIGEDGIATVSLPTSPWMYLIEEICGLENTYYLLQDCRDELEHILAKLHAANKRLATTLAICPAQVIIEYEDTSTTLMSPAIFRRYCLPFINEYGEIIGGAGKLFLVHMCGKLHALVNDLSKLVCTGFSDISPPPTGDLPLDEAAANLPGKVLIGGIDPNTFVSSDEQAVEEEISGLIARIQPFRGVLLGSADTMPRGTRPENVRLIRSMVDLAGG